MKTELFEAFAEMIEGVSAGNIVKDIELERLALKDNLLYKRVSAEEVASIFSFCEFVKSVTEEDNDLIPIELPGNQIARFRKIVTRLIEAGELPACAIKQFDLTFSPGLLKAPANQPVAGLNDRF
jgi:hypothetical protein